MSNIGSFFNLGSQTTLVNENKKTLRLKINPLQSTDVSFVFPLNEGDVSGYVLATDGSGTTAWVAPSGGSTNPAGNNTEIQFNDSGAFGANSNLTFDSTTNILGVIGDISLNGNILMSSGISIGNTTSGLVNQSSTAIAIGYVAGAINQDSSLIAIGNGARNQDQSNNAIAIGYDVRTSITRY